MTPKSEARNPTRPGAVPHEPASVLAERLLHRRRARREAREVVVEPVEAAVLRPLDAHGRPGHAVREGQRHLVREEDRHAAREDDLDFVWVTGR